MLFRLLLLCASTSALWVNFYQNGEHFTELDGQMLELANGYKSKSTQDIIDDLEHVLVPSLIRDEDDLRKCTVFDSEGLIITKGSQFVKEGDYYIVPRNKNFVWPFVKIGRKIKIKNVEPGDPANPVYLESIGKSPRVFFVHNLMSEEEADSLVQENEPNVYKSTVGSGDDDQIRLDSGRTSDNTWDMNSPAAKKIISRVFDILRIKENPNQMDGLQMVRYKEKQFYNSHFDFLETESATEFNNMIPKAGGSNRFATLFLYLTDVDTGGQTAFPEANHLTDEELEQVSDEVRPLLMSHKDEEDKRLISEMLSEGKKGVGSLEMPMAEKCYSNLSVKAKKLAGVLFYSLTPTWDFDYQALHGGCPVLKGKKWGANLWVWNIPRTEEGEKLPVVLKFTNTFSKAGKLFWRSEELMNIEPGESSVHNSFNTHLFRFEIDGEPVWSHKANSSDGAEQTIFINDRLEVTFENKLTFPIGVYWSNPEDGSEVLLSDCNAYGGKSTHGTYLGHVFHFYNDDKLVYVHTMVAGNKPQVLVAITEQQVEWHRMTMKRGKKNHEEL